MVRERNDGRERERDRQREARKRDRIGAILEEVINRCESKIDLFCSGSRPGDEPERTLCAASPHTHTHTRVRSYTCVRLYVYIYIYISIHTAEQKMFSLALARAKSEKAPRWRFYARMSPG